MALVYGANDNLTVQLAGPYGSAAGGSRLTTVTLPATQWKNGESPYFQTVEVEGISVTSVVDIQLSPEQTETLCRTGTALHMENDGGIVTARAIGTVPGEDLVLQVTLTEVIRT